MKKKFIDNTIFYVSVISITATIILGIFIYNIHTHFEKIVVDQIKEQLMTIANTSSKNMHATITGIQADLQVLALNPKIPIYLKTQEDLSEIAKQWLFSIKNTLGRFGTDADVIYMLNHEGKVCSRIPYKDNWVGHDYSEKPSVKYVISNHKPCITEVISNSGIRSIAICVPVFDQGEFVGALRSLINFDTIGKLIQTIRFGKYGHAELVNFRSGTIVYHPQGFDMDKVENEEVACPQDKWSQEIVDEMASQDCGVNIYDYHQKTKIVAFSSINVGTEPWYVVVTLPYSEVDEPIHWHGINICIFGGIIVFILGIGGATFYRLKRKKLLLKQKSQFYQKSVQQIQKLNSFNEIILASIPLALMIVDDDYHVVRVNQTYRDEFGLQSDEFITLDGTYFGRVSNDSILPDSTIGKMLVQIYNNEVAEIKAHEIATKDKRFSIFIVKLDFPQLYPTEIFASNCEETEYLVVIENITEQRKLQEEIQRKEAEIFHSTRLASLGEMATGIAHELNQPLTAIMNYAENSIDILDFENNDSSKSVDSIKKIITQVRRAKNIIQHLRDFARREEDQKYIKFDLQIIVAKILQFLKHQINLNEIEIETHFCTHELPCLGNILQMEQVFTNIIVNAIDAISTDSQNQHRKITVSTKCEDNNAIIEINDNGIGFKEESRLKLFDPFFTTKEPGKGTGLGLSISYRIIKEHGGQIYAKKNDPQGAKFTIVLPITTLE